MQRKAINTEHIEGRVYEHELTIKTVQNQQSSNYGKEFISGTLSVAVDEEGMNIVEVHFTYVTETTKAGKKNATYTALKKIIDEGKAWITDGKDEATKVKIDTALALNDFYVNEDTLVSQKVNEGGFVTIVSNLCKENERNTFTTDMLMTSMNRVEANEEKGILNDYLTIRGAIFNFKNDILPVEFVLKNPEGIKYFENLDFSSSEPLFTKVWGRINCRTIVVEQREESAFGGEVAVKSYEKKSKEWEIIGVSLVPYDFGDEKVLTAEEVTQAMQNREVHLAEVKKRREEYLAQKAANGNLSSPKTSTVSVSNGGFNF